MPLALDKGHCCDGYARGIAAPPVVKTSSGAEHPCSDAWQVGACCLSLNRPHANAQKQPYIVNDDHLPLLSMGTMASSSFFLLLKAPHVVAC